MEVQHQLFVGQYKQLLEEHHQRFEGELTQLREFKVLAYVLALQHMHSRWLLLLVVPAKIHSMKW